MTRYRIPAEWGGGEADEVDYDVDAGAKGLDAPEGYRAVCRGEGEWVAFLPVAVLSEVPPPETDEPPSSLIETVAEAIYLCGFLAAEKPRADWAKAGTNTRRLCIARARAAAAILGGDA